MEFGKEGAIMSDASPSGMAEYMKMQDQEEDGEGSRLRRHRTPLAASSTRYLDGGRQRQFEERTENAASAADRPSIMARKVQVPGSSRVRIVMPTYSVDEPMGYEFDPLTVLLGP